MGPLVETEQTPGIFQKWGSRLITGDEVPKKPPLLAFKEADKAIEILRKHINRNSFMGIHGDVDMDGIGTTYMLKRFLNSQSSNNQLFIINKEKVHGIQEKHVEYFNNVNKIDLLIVLDSSTNDIELIKKLDCDVIVIDHHEILHDDYYGVRDNGTEYVIINNMIENNQVDGINELIKSNNQNTTDEVGEYVVDSDMSCGVTLYELLRVYSVTYGIEHILEDLKLVQWAGITLFSDAISLMNERNQYYIDNTINQGDLEPNLNIILKELNKYKFKVDKSFLNYTFIPIINRAIRAGASGEVLSIILNDASRISELQVYKEQQDRMIELGKEGARTKGSYVLRDITNTEIHPNYTGVIAGKLADNHRNAVVYRSVGDGRVRGSFRGRTKDTDYRKIFEKYREGNFAQGHAPAFGFEVQLEDLDGVMASLEGHEKSKINERYLTAGEMAPEDRGKYHIEDINEFKRQGNLWRLAIGNSKVSSHDEINITTRSAIATLTEIKGKLYIYEVLGIVCKAFEKIDTRLINIYVEQSNEIEAFIRNVKEEEKYETSEK